MNKKLKPELIYQIVSILLGSIIVWRSMLSLDGAESGKAAAGFLSGRVVEEYMLGLSYVRDDGQEMSGQKEVLKQVCRSLPLISYLSEMSRDAAAVENEDLYDWIRWKEGTDEQEHQVREEDGQAETESEKPQDKITSDIEIKEDGQDEIRLEKLNDFDYLLSHFYSVDRTTTIDGNQLCAEKLLEKDMSITGESNQPQILIYHTHSTESFSDSIPGRSDMTVVGVGAKLAEELRGYGYHVLHDTTAFDATNRDYAYSNAEPAITELLAKNPSIEVVIDLHRDGVSESTRLVTEIDGKKTAQFMFFNGLSRTTAQGDIEYLKNPYIEDNLAFSLQLQLAATKRYPGIARKIYLKGYRYNMHFRPKSLLIEVGAQTNTVEEVMNAVPPLGEVLHSVLDKN